MYAVIETGGKQYRVSPGDRIRIEKIDVDEGGAIEFNKVLMVTSDDKVSIGSPTVEGAVVKARVETHGRDKKIIVFKYKNKSKQSRKTQGHRQSFTSVLIDSIEY